jgi:hypothetical protein
MANIQLTVVADEDVVEDSKGIWDQTDKKLRKVLAVGADELSTRVQELAEGLSQVLERVHESIGKYGLDALEVTAEITARGEVRLLGCVGSDIKGGLKLVFRRK